MKKEEVTAVVAKVTRKGQVTIPADFRKEHRIKEGGRVAFQSSNEGLVLIPLPSLEELAGVDSPKIKYREAVKWLDKSRSEDRY
jgi:AbrB family looped-hinge helix DNA binding protein